MTEDRNILVSACLFGENCSYDGFARENPKVVQFCRGKSVIRVCPEMLAGIGCPRERHEIVGGDGGDVLEGNARVFSISGKDRTGQFVSGAEETLCLAQKNDCSVAILKEKSPSCGVRLIHSGKFNSVTIPGLGVTAALLKTSGIKVIPDTEIL